MSIENIVEILEDGTIKFYKPDTKILHRVDGPAVIFPSGFEQYWIDGEEVNKDNVNESSGYDIPDESFAYLDNPFICNNTERDSIENLRDHVHVYEDVFAITAPRLFVFFAVIWFIFGGIAIVNGEGTPGYSGIIISQMYVVCYYFSKVLEKKENPRDECND